MFTKSREKNKLTKLSNNQVGSTKFRFFLFFFFLRGSEHLEFLSPLVDGFGNSHDCLDSAANLNSTRSDWVLVYTSGKVSVLRQRDLRKEWTFISPPMHRCDQEQHCNTQYELLCVTTESVESRPWGPLWTSKLGFCSRMQS